MKGLYWAEAQRQLLEAELKCTSDAAVFRRALALLEVDSGRTAQDLAKTLQIQPGQGRPQIWDEEINDLIHSALANPPPALGFTANSWTLPLLHRLLFTLFPQKKISTDTLRRRLKENGYSWKRFRYTLKPDPEAEKKTPDFRPHQGFSIKHHSSGRR
jgi:transposase